MKINRCDVCQTDVVRHFELNELKECYQIPGVVHLCGPCMGTIEDAILRFDSVMQRGREGAVKRFLRVMLSREAKRTERAEVRTP